MNDSVRASVSGLLDPSYPIVFFALTSYSLKHINIHKPENFIWIAQGTYCCGAGIFQKFLLFILYGLHTHRTAMIKGNLAWKQDNSMINTTQSLNSTW